MPRYPIQQSPTPPPEQEDRRHAMRDRLNVPYRQQLGRRGGPPTGGGGAVLMAIVGLGVLLLWLRHSGLPAEPFDRIVVFGMLAAVVVALVQILSPPRNGDD